MIYFSPICRFLAQLCLPLETLLFVDMLFHPFSATTPHNQVLECFFPYGLGIHLSLPRGRNYFIIPECRTLGTHAHQNYVVS